MSIENQNNRLLSIDLARGLAVFFMIAVHTLTIFGNKEVNESILGQIIAFLGGPPAAPIFMTLMGFSFLFSSKSNFNVKLIRGFKIFLLGYVLNIFRGVIPFTIATYIRPDIISLEQFNGMDAYELFFMVDILQFAGLALMLLAIIQKYNLNKYVILSVAILVSLVSPFLWGIKTNLPLIDFVLDLLWGDHKIALIENRVAFPLFPWFTFPLLGLFLGDLVKKSPKQWFIFKQFGIIGFVVLLIGLIWSTINLDYQFNDFYHSRQGAMIFMCGFILVWIYICKLITDYIPNNIIFKIIYDLSKGVTNIYFTQWLLICWGIALFGIQDNSYFITMILIIVVTGISYLINYLTSKKKIKSNFLLKKEV